MHVTVGKHAGKSVELLILKFPDYVHWLLKTSVSGPLLIVKTHIKTLIAKFDAKPLLRDCRGHNCNLKATRATVYGINLTPEWWCANCDPYQLGANPGKLQAVKTYGNALDHVEFYCSSRKSDFQEIIKYLAQAKGLPSRAGEVQCKAFFAVI